MNQLDTPPCHGSSCRTVSFMATFRKVGPVAWSSKLSGPSSTWTFLGDHGPMPKSICLVIFDLKLNGWFNSSKIHENPLYHKRKAPIVAEFGHLLRKILRLKLHRAVDTPTSVAFIERCRAIVIYHGHQWDLWLISPMINCHYRNWPHPEIWNISSSGAPDKEDALLVKGQHRIVIDLSTKGVIGPNVNDGPRIFETKAQDHVLAWRWTEWDPVGRGGTHRVLKCYTTLPYAVTLHLFTWQTLDLPAKTPYIA